MPVRDIDEAKTYHHRQPKCPDALKPALMAKIGHYMRAGWWFPITTTRATPMLCIPKSAKNPNELRTVFNLREQNLNTHKDLTPMPDQDAIQNAVTKARYRSKCDISNAYELIWVELEDVWKTAFSTIAGTFASNVMQKRRLQCALNIPEIHHSPISRLHWEVRVCLLG